MIWFELIEDLGDGTSTTRRFKTLEEAEEYEKKNEEFCYFGIDVVDTDSKYFWFQEDV